MRASRPRVGLRAIATWAVTWAPRLTLPTTSITTTVPSTSTTEPVKTSLSPGYAGAPSRIAIDCTLHVGAGPVGDVPLDQAVGGQDVQEDVLRAVGLRQVAVVVHVLEVAGRDRGADHQRGRHRQPPLGELVARASIMPASRRAGSGRRRSPGSRPATGMPISTSSGSQSTSSASIRAPSSRSTRASRIGSSRPGTGGCRCTTYENTVPRPDATTCVRSIAWHAGQDGPGRVAQRAAGGALLDPQLARRVPSQKNSVSRLTGGAEHVAPRRRPRLVRRRRGAPGPSG